MPELPDVEVFRRYLDATALHQPVDRVQVRDADLLRDVSRRTLQRRLKGERLEATRRHGKYLLAGFRALLAGRPSARADEGDRGEGRPDGGSPELAPPTPGGGRLLPEVRW